MRRCTLALGSVFALLTTGIVAAAEAPGRAPLPSGVTARSGGDITEATLIGATARYKHFVLGTPYEAAGLRVRRADGRTVELMLPDDSVFEDRQPRIADLDGDGRSEVVVVVSRKASGSALAVLGLRDGALKILAESTPNGAPQRWLNPAGIGRFLNNGRRQVALVRMPHAVGRLEFWDFDGRALRFHGGLENTSNHRIGSDQMNLSAVIARDAMPTDLLAVPDFSRRNLRIVTALPTPRDVAIFPLDAEVVGNLRVERSAEGVTILAPVAGGAVRRVSLGKDILMK